MFVMLALPIVGSYKCIVTCCRMDWGEPSTSVKKV